VRRHEHRLARGLRLGDQLEKGLLEQGIEPARRLVEDEELRLVHERLDQADLLPIAPGQAADARAQVELEPIRELLDACLRDATAEMPEVGEQLRARLPIVDHEVAGEVADPATQRRTALARVRPSTEARPPLGRIRSSRMRIVVVLPAPFGPRKP
jgi:hypothetical protein